MSDEDTKPTPTAGKAISNQVIELDDDNEQSTALNRMLWDGNFPSPDGIIARRLAKQSIPLQHMQFAALAEILQNHPDDFKNLQLYAKNATIMYHLPGNARKVRVLHTIATSDALAQEDESDDSNKYLVALAGEYIEDMLFPTIHQFQIDEFRGQLYKQPSREEYIKAVVSINDNETNDNKIAFKFNKSSLADQELSSQIQAVPPYLVYDAIEDGMDSIVLFERIHHVLEETPNINGAKYLQNLLQFLQLGLVAPTSKQNIALPPEHNLTRPTKDMLMWRRKMLTSYTQQVASESTKAIEATPPVSTGNSSKAGDETSSKEHEKQMSTTTQILSAASKAGMYDPPLSPATKARARKRSPSPPNLTPATPDSTASSPEAAPVRKKGKVMNSANAAAAPTFQTRTTEPVETAVASDVNNTLQFNEGTFIQLLKLIRLNDAGAGASAISAPAGKFETLGLPESTFNNLLILCGLTPDLRKDIPELWMRMGEAGLNKADKNNIIRHALQNNLLFKNSKVPLIQPIFTMIRDRAFAGEYAVSSLTAAVKGLSPFIVPFLTQAQIDEANKNEEDLERATSIKPQDVAGNRMVCTLPPSFDHMVRQIKRFANLVHALFGDTSPMVAALEAVVNELEDQTEIAIAKVSKENIASILWIIMLQARHFAAGQMVHDDLYIPSFQVLLNNLEMKNVHGISHGEVPPELYTPKPVAPPTKRPRAEAQLPQQDEQRKKRVALENDKVAQWKERPEYYNQKLKADMATIKAMVPRPSITKLCRAAGTSPAALFPSNKKVCIRSQIWGACEHSCPHQHIVMGDAEIDHARDQLKKVVNNPSLLNKV